MLFELIRTFAAEESGVVTTDWVMLTAGVVMLGVSAASVVGDGSEHLGDEIGASVAVFNGD